mmetsp:Transcript_22550/g.51586  ORF Transcript_22550/g.51586 Transcript_22550/m.51586 type:complete len:231 (-) Transcript_22550:689-1381(-)
MVPRVLGRIRDEHAAAPAARCGPAAHLGEGRHHVPLARLVARFLHHRRGEAERLHRLGALHEHFHHLRRHLGYDCRRWERATTRSIHDRRASLPGWHFVRDCPIHRLRHLRLASLELLRRWRHLPAHHPGATARLIHQTKWLFVPVRQLLPHFRNWGAAARSVHSQGCAHAAVLARRWEENLPLCDHAASLILDRTSLARQHGRGLPHASRAPRAQALPHIQARTHSRLQ